MTIGSPLSLAGQGDDRDTEQLNERDCSEQSNEDGVTEDLPTLDLSGLKAGMMGLLQEKRTKLGTTSWWESCCPSMMS